MNIAWTEILVIAGVVVLPCLGIFIVSAIIAVVILLIKKTRKQD
jgi:hypothetical protein